jgi:hypothetical protein
MRIRCAERVYEASLALLRNTAEALSPTGDSAGRVAGSLTNRRYEVVFDTEDEGRCRSRFFSCTASSRSGGRPTGREAAELRILRRANTALERCG